MTGTPPGAGRRHVRRSATVSRRDALRYLGAGALWALLPSTAASAQNATAPFTHPEPRPDVDASRVLSRDAVSPHVADLFDGVRAIPQVLDGIGCHCGCGELPEMRSLLSCYEGMGMAQYCEICSGEGRLAVALHGEGKTLDEIRAAIDRRFG